MHVLVTDVERLDDSVAAIEGPAVSESDLGTVQAILVVN